MEAIGQTPLLLRNDKGQIAQFAPRKVRESPPTEVANFKELADRIAEIQFENPQFVFMFRGQGQEYFRRRATSIKPSIFRGADGKLPDLSELKRRYNTLRCAEDLLVQTYEGLDIRGKTRLKRHRVMRWSILQHYDVCPTPLLDVSQSLRIAASFATDDFNKRERKASDRAVLYVLGLPNLIGAVSGSLDAGIQTIRLASVCPPEAKRPHFQEGYLIGEFPELAEVRDKENYEAFEVDVARRLVAKFSFDPWPFWANSSDFPLVSRAALYPDENSKIFKELSEMKQQLSGKLL